MEKPFQGQFQKDGSDHAQAEALDLRPTCSAASREAVMPKAHLQWVDWVVIGAYFLSLVVIGLYYRRFAGRSMDDYFLSGRRNSGWANGVSYAAAMMNADVAPAYSGLAVATGVFVSWFYLSRFGIALFIGAILFAVFWRRLQLFTAPEFYELRFGGVASNIIRTWVATRSSLIAMVAWTGTGLLAMYKIAGPVLGLSKTQTMLVVLPIVLVYAGVAGFSAVVATAGLQSLIMFIGSGMLCGIVLYSIGGPASLHAQLEQVAGGVALAGFPPVTHDVFPMAAAIAWLVGTSIGYGGDAAPLGGAMEGQYVLSSRNTREASKMYLSAEITLFILLLLVTLPSLAALVQWPWLNDPRVDREQAYGLLIAKYLPPGMLGLLFVVMLAAVMSTIASNLIFGGQVLVSDVYRRYLAPARSDRHYLWIGRAAALLILLLALIVTYKVELIFHVAVFMVAASAAELPANWAQWWWWRFNRWGRLTASIGGIVIPALLWFVLPTSEWPWWDRTYVGILANTALWLTVTLLTPADDAALLERFYRRGRPLGRWGPIRARLEGDAQPVAGRHGGAGLIFAGLGLALLGAGSIMLMTVGLSHLYVGRYGQGGLELAGFILGGGLFLRWYGGYIDRLEAWAGPPESPIQIGSTTTTGLGTERPEEPATVESRAFPVRTSVVVALATVAFGVVILLAGIIGCRGGDRLLNVIGGLAFLVSAVVVWWMGRPSTQESAQEG